MTSRPGDRVEVRMAKWGDRPHYEFAGVHLGDDEHGTWLGWPTGTRYRRPGVDFVSEADAVTLVGDRWSLPTFYGPGFRIAVYVDVTTRATWEQEDDGPVVRAVDLDLDVVRLADGTVYVDDEDEFDDHRVRFDYPDDVVRAARAECAVVHAAVRDGEPPYDGAAAVWLQRLAERSERSDG